LISRITKFYVMLRLSPLVIPGIKPHLRVLSKLWAEMILLIYKNLKPTFKSIFKNIFIKCKFWKTFSKNYEDKIGISERLEETWEKKIIFFLILILYESTNTPLKMKLVNTRWFIKIYDMHCLHFYVGKSFKIVCIHKLLNMSNVINDLVQFSDRNKQTIIIDLQKLFTTICSGAVVLPNFDMRTKKTSIKIMSLRSSQFITDQKEKNSPQKN
jgi:hypothetical protein